MKNVMMTIDAGNDCTSLNFSAWSFLRRAITPFTAHFLARASLKMKNVMMIDAGNDEVRGAKQATNTNPRQTYLPQNNRYHSRRLC